MDKDGGALEWSRSHNSEFSYEKLGLLNCACRSQDLGPSLLLRSYTVQPTDSHKFLGVILDSKLSFHHHVAYALAKGSKWVAQLRRVMRPTMGTAFRLAKRLYMGVAVPGYLYAADVFLTPLRYLEGQTRQHGSVGAINKLNRIHRQALIMVSGAMRTTATDILSAHCDILPFPLLIDKLCQRSAVRLCALPQSHPLAKHVARAAN
ncbi:hypothetical protein OBBRIDRAFT_742824, partial [Obba rivulosa]